MRMHPRLASTAAALGCLLLGAAVSVRLGQDGNWDLMNYHISNVHAVMAGRLDIDLIPAGLQSYFNPTLDFFYVLLARGPLASQPRLLAATMGLFYGGLVFVALRLAWALLPARPLSDRLVLTAVVTAAATTGAATVPQIGTTLNDIPPALLVLSGLLLALGPIRAGARTRWAGPLPLARMAGIGALFGLAGGLKLTAIIFAPACCLALLLVARPRPWFALCLAFSLGWAIGFLVPAGWWGWQVWQRFGSPTFPLFNALFQSPWYPPESFFDARFLPRTTLEWLAYPFWWITLRHPARPAELHFRDPRLALMLLAIVAVILAGMWRRLRGVVPGGPTRPAWRADRRFVFGFLALGYVIWLTGASILRYAVVLEVLGVIVLALTVIAACDRLPRGRLAALVVVPVLCLAIMLWTRPMNWGRVPYGPQVFAVDMGWVPPGALLIPVTGDGPAAYLTAFVPPEAGARVLGFSYPTLTARGWPLGAESLRRVREHPGPIFLLIPRDEKTLLPHLGAIGLSPELGPCRPVTSNLDGNTTRACEARRLP